MNNMEEYKGIYAFHPGNYVKDIMDELGITQDEFARRLNVSSKTISELVNGKMDMTKNIALALSNAFGYSVSLWLNLQAKYEAKKLEIENAKRLEKEKELFDLLNYQYFIKNAGLRAYSKWQEKAEELRLYLNIAGFSVLETEAMTACYRISSRNVKHKNIVCAGAWLLFVQKKALEQRQGKPFNEKALQDAMPEIRSMTSSAIQDKLPRLKEIFDSCGVIFISTPMFPNSKVSGVVKWFNDNKKAYLAINDRLKTEDSFWFTLFHEIKHVLQKNYRKTLVNLEDDDICSVSDALIENEADEFAKNMLISPSHYADFIAVGDFSDNAIMCFAQKEQIDSGIVAGRLAKEKHVPFAQVNHLRRHFEL